MNEPACRVGKPNKQTTDGNYRYAFQGQEKDGETDMEAFELRLWDGRLGRWSTIDPAGEFHSPYLGMGNDPINAIDPDGGDIIYLNSSKAVHGFGHAAVLIGNDKDGWRYLSMNGTGDGAKPLGDSKNADLGDEKFNKRTGYGNDFRGTGLTAKQVMKLVNTSNRKEKHHYDRAIRIKTTVAEDKIAYEAAKKQAGGKTYGIFGSSCVDVPQAAFLSVVNKRLNESDNWKLSFMRPSESDMGFYATVPNLWFDGFFGNNFIKNHMNVINNFLDNNFEYNEVHTSPRDF